jgi:hypothetical protein
MDPNPEGIVRGSVSLMFTGLGVAALTLACPAASATPADDPPVIVIVDMDALTPGFQSSVVVPAGQSVLSDVAVYVIDPLGTREIYGIGYLGGIDRGIAFGHVPDPSNAGEVAELVGRVGAPVHPDNFGMLWTSPLVDPAFPGPEVQYVEGGSAEPAAIPADPAAPIFLVDFVLENTEPGDRFDFHLFDLVRVWSGGQGGAFSTTGGVSLDTGGDAVPDSTQSIYGVDADDPIPVPPAAFLVDLIDGGDEPGPATVVVGEAVSVGGEGGADDPGAGEVASSHPRAWLRAIGPNPFRSWTTVHYELADPGEVRLELHDVQGRSVRVLVRSSHHDGGRHEVSWDGRDQLGRPVAAGVYTVRLRAGGVESRQRVIALR